MGGGGEGENHSLTELIMMNDSSDKCIKFFPLIHEYFGDVRLFKIFFLKFTVRQWFQQ